MGAPKKKSVEQRLLELLGSPQYQPLNKSELAKNLQIPLNERSKFRRLLNDLETAGKITRIRKDRYVVPQEADLMVGVLQVNPDGFGYLLNESGDGLGDLYISAENQGTAMHKDRVVARIIRDRVLPERGRRNRANREGRVIKILVRANRTIVGTLQRSKNFYYVVPDEPALVHDIYVPAPPDKLPRMPQVNDKVVVEVEPWEHRNLNPEGAIVEVLGSAQEPGVAILSIIRKYDLPVAFPEAVLNEAEQVPLDIPENDLRSREDLRSMPVFTIDPDNARDFDDAIHVTDVEGGGWSIGIHIADVSHYVKPGGALDREALRRGNSVYLPDRVLPMLPERLSNMVCSLRPNEDHLTKSVFVEFDRSGRIKSCRFAATVIRSVARYTYGEAFAILQRAPASPIERGLHRAWQLASILREKRFKQGALGLDMPEVRVVLDGDGKAVGLVREENDISHQLVEEFMLLANELVAHETRERLIPSVYRIHEEPDAQRLADYREQIQSYGIEVGDLSHRREMQRFLKLVVGRPEEAALKIGLLRSLRKAAYSPEAIGHYGLAKTDYTHFTSPIRRYADLLVHRSFAAMLPRRGKPPRSIDLAATSEHISATERTASEAEREAVRLKKMEYFAGLARKPHRLEGTILDVRNYGLLVELKEALVVGMIRISSLEHDFFVFDPTRQRITGRRSKMSFAVGDRVVVRVARVDTFRQRIDFAFLAKE